MNWRARILTPEQLADLREHPDHAPELAEFGAKEPGTLHLHQLWHGLNWLLKAAEDVPQGAEDSILGGRDIGATVGPTGPARLLDPDTVSAANDALAVATADDLRAAYDQDDMLEESVFPPIWADQDVLEGKIVPAFTKLQKFYAKAAEANAAILTAID